MFLKACISFKDSSDMTWCVDIFSKGLQSRRLDTHLLVLGLEVNGFYTSD